MGWKLDTTRCRRLTVFDGRQGAGKVYERGSAWLLVRYSRLGHQSLQKPSDCFESTPSRWRGCGRFEEEGSGLCESSSKHPGGEFCARWMWFLSGLTRCSGLVLCGCRQTVWEGDA